MSVSKIESFAFFSNLVSQQLNSAKLFLLQLSYQFEYPVLRHDT